MIGELLSYTFFQHALWGILLSSIVCGIIGSYVVSRRLTFLAGGITHASFGGIGLALYLGISPIGGAMGAAILSAIAIDRLTAGGTRQDATIASIWALGMALGILFMGLTPGYSAGLSGYLFGNILLITRQDLWLLMGFSLLILALFSLAYKPIVYAAFDEDFARSRGLHPRRWNGLMLIVTAIALVLSIRLVGIMLLLSMLTLPQMTMQLFTARLRLIMLGSVLISLVASSLGLMLSATILPAPTGAIIIILLFLLFLLGKIYRYIGQKIRA